ncbi:MAG: hypothetical protein Q9201_003056 [Fulgogasparrea decipioides]
MYPSSSLDLSGCPSKKATFKELAHRPFQADHRRKPDKAYRRYAAGVDRALSLFDTALQEWADYISFLGRLLKVIIGLRFPFSYTKCYNCKALQLHPPGVSDIPHKTLVAQRLSQCLNPPLGAGVHQKALEVYAYIFSLIGRDGLGRDLPQYLPGLSPVLAFASLSVKQPLLSLFDTFVVALDPFVLRPALKAVVLALLPGLEEESSEEFEKTHDILQGLKSAVGGEAEDQESVQDASGDQFFWQCMFLATITSPSRRPGALAYLQRHLPRLTNSTNSRGDVKGKPEESETKLSYNAEAVTSPEPGLLIRCFAAGLGDDQILVQRGFLDLLVTHLPLDSVVLRQKVTPGDLVKLATAAVSVVLRREMSLNRRLWTWFLGSKEPVSEANGGPAASDSIAARDKARRRQITYFRLYGLTPLVQGIMTLFETDSATSAEKARPFRISLALMDRWELGGLVVPNIFLPAVRSIWRHQKTASLSDEFAEVLRSAKVFFDGVESGLIWDEISNKLLRATEMHSSDPQELLEGIELTSFVIKHFNIQEEEMLLGHIPLLASSLLLKAKALSIGSKRTQGQGLVERILSFIGQLLDVVPGRAFDTHDLTPLNLSVDTGSSLDIENQNFLAGMQRLYKVDQGNIRSLTSSVDNKAFTRLLLFNTLQMVMSDLRCIGAERCLEMEISILDKLLRRTSAAQLLDVPEMLCGIHEASERLVAAGHKFTGLKDVTLVLSLLEAMQAALSSTSWLDDHRLRLVLPKLMTALWSHLSPASSKSNLEAVRCVWRIQQLSIEEKLVESCIAALMVESASNSRRQVLDVENARRFTTLWSHSNSGSRSHARRSSLVPGTPRIGSMTNRAEKEHILARPLLLLLDALDDPKTDLFSFTSGWLQSSANVQVYDALLWDRKAEESACLRNVGFESSRRVDAEDFADDLDECLYYLRTISNLVEYTSRDIWPSLLSQVNRREQDDRLASKHSQPRARSTEKPEKSHAVIIQMSLARICLGISSKEFGLRHTASREISRLQQTAVSLLQEIILRSTSIVDLEPELESSIIDILNWSTRKPDHPLQVSVMSLISAWLERRMNDRSGNISTTHRRILSGDRSSSVEKLDGEGSSAPPATPPPLLLDCVLEGLGSVGSQPVLHHWVRFLEYVLPLYNSNLFQMVMPLVDRFIKIVQELFRDLQSSFDQDSQTTVSLEPVNTIIELLNGLEQTLARAHDRLIEEQMTQSNTRIPEPTQGFFGNMVSGVFPSEVHNSRSATANSRLTVILCFKDAIKLCLRLWSWDAERSEGAWRDPALSGSFNYTSLRLKNRARRILEHLLTAEPLECLETLIDSWLSTRGSVKPQSASPVTLNLLHVLDGSRPRNTIPAIFNALYSRTNPSALDPDRKSTLTSDLSDTDLACFLVEYTRSLEDDAMDEIWSDCMTFLKDVLANPLPHRQTLPKLLEFTALLGSKVDNTSFGENRRRRRELGDLFLRQLTATFTIKPLSFTNETSSARKQKFPNGPQLPLKAHSESLSDDIVAVLAAIFPDISKILVDSDRITTASNTISAQVVVPTIRWKSFPQNVTSTFLDLLLILSRVPEAAKVWNKDVTEAFNDSRFFCNYSYGLASSRWLPLLRQWIVTDKDRINEFLSRIPPPTSAGIMFGVGASSARLEADRRAQLNLRRVATLLLATQNDSFMMKVGTTQEKIADLLSATAASSPSSATRAEIYMVLRALVLKTSPVHLASLWPMITTELQEALSSLYPGRDRDRYNMYCIVHACKLLDLLVLVAPDEFQMRQWLFITDTIDAVYRPHDLKTRALVDDLAEDLDANSGTVQSATIAVPTASQIGRRKPLLTTKVLQEIPKEQLLDRAIRPFLRQLSISAFEGTYSMTGFDWQAAYEDLLFDIFDDKNLV